MNYFLEPINLTYWPGFSELEVGHVERFLATSDMHVGDILFLHIGGQSFRYASGIYAMCEIITEPYILHGEPDDYCNEKNCVEGKVLKIDHCEPFVSHNECLSFINQYRNVSMINQEDGLKIYNYISSSNGEHSYNNPRVEKVEDWINVLKDESGIIMDIFMYMLKCKDQTTNGSKIAKALKLDSLPNLDIYRFGERVIKKLGIPEQVRINGDKMYWNIPFETVYEKNKDNVFTWRLRSELVEALREINKEILVDNNVDKEIKDYIKFNNPDDFDDIIQEELKVREDFVKKFNIGFIMSMSLDDFVIGKVKIEESGKDAFCYLLERKMGHLGEARGSFVDKFGVWYSRDNHKYMNTKKFGDNVDDAFLKLKKCICELIAAGSRDDYEEIERSIISPLFKGKILSTYYPNKYLPIFDADDVDLFLNILDISYDVHVYDNLEKKKNLLKEYKNFHPILSKYSDYYFVRFLYDTYRKELKDPHTVKGEIDYDFEVVDFNYLGNHEKEKRNTYRSRETDYENINRNKKDVGNRGEKAVLNYEKKRLTEAGYPELADKVDISDNDAIGYDIVSYNEDGSEKHIEVKTNSGSSKNIMDFYLSLNELEKMIEDPAYNIYYLFNIKKNPKLHIVNKDVLMQNKDLYLKPVIYKIEIDVEQVK